MWPVWAAFVWAVAFGLLSLYWAAGGTIGISTLAKSIQSQSRQRDPGLRWATLVTGLLKIAAGLLALSTILPIGLRLPRRPMLLGLWGAGAGFLVYGLLNFADVALMALDVRDVPGGFGEDAVIWYLTLWEPLWIIGGVFFLLTARRFTRVSR